MQRTITAAELRSLIDRRAPLTLCDVRRAEALAKDPVAIPGASWVDPALVDDWSGTLNPDVEIVLYCVHGHSISNSVVHALQTKGFSARFVEGGLEAWKQGGGDTEAQS